jgi:hypothetical protein
MKPALLHVHFPALLLTALTAFCFAHAETRYVSKTGSDTPPYTSWETAASSIQSAIDAASDGDTVLIGPGVFMESITLKSSLTLRGAGQGVTIIDPLYGGPVVTCANLVSTRIEGLTITGGDQSRRGGGIYIKGCADAVIRDCQITGNRADYQDAEGVGGGICALSSEISLEDCVITNNVAREDGGGVLLGCAGKICRISGCEIIGNRALQGWGGGIFCYCLGEIRNCVIVDNQAAGDGGGIFCAEATVVDQCVILNNRVEGAMISERWGAGVYYAGGPGGALTNCVIGGNSAAEGYSAGVFWETDCNIVNCTFLYQEGEKWSIPIEVGYPAEDFGTYENITNCVFSGQPNVVLGGRVTYSLVPDLTYAQEGEGNVEGAPDFRVRTSYWVRSLGSYDARRGVTSFLCYAPVGARDEFKHMFDTRHYRETYLIAGNSENEIFLYGNVSGWPGADITDLSPSEDSPCIDAGNNEAEYLPDVDKAGNFRIWRGKDEWQVDMGAYEYGARRFQIAAVAPTAEPGLLRLTWNSQDPPEKTYSVYLSPDLANWILVGSNIPSQGETTSWVDPVADLFSSRFYRISSP